MPIADVMTVQTVSARPEETVQAAIARMVEENVGSVAVCEGTRLVGMFTERDVLRLTGEGVQLEELLVGDVMTTRLVTVSSDDDIVAVAHLMGERRIRHVPVLEGDNLVGIVGIRDILGVLAEMLWKTHDEKAHETVRELLTRGPRAF